MNYFRNLVLVLALAPGWVGVSSADEFPPVPGQTGTCGSQELLTAIDAIKTTRLAQVTAEFANAGIFNPKKVWWAVVDRAGRLCAVDKIGDAWPDSRAIAIAKAGTANGFSNDGLALSTANLYAATQPGGALYGLNNSNPFNSVYLPARPLSDEVSAIGRVNGGIVTFGGGVALFSAGRQVIGGLGISGDTPCIDHAIAYRLRALLALNSIPVAPAGLNANDNIIFPRGNNKPSGFEHPRCGANLGHGKGGHHGHDDKDDRDDKDEKDKRDGKGGKY